jgi:hypothetical protein
VLSISDKEGEELLGDTGSLKDVDETVEGIRLDISGVDRALSDTVDDGGEGVDIEISAHGEGTLKLESDVGLVGEGHGDSVESGSIISTLGLRARVLALRARSLIVRDILTLLLIIVLELAVVLDDNINIVLVELDNDLVINGLNLGIAKDIALDNIFKRGKLLLEVSELGVNRLSDDGGDLGEARHATDSNRGDTGSHDGGRSSLASDASDSTSEHLENRKVGHVR